MTEEKITAEQLRGYQFFNHPEMPTVGILRLDTENNIHWLMVTRDSLKQFSEALTKHVEDIEPVSS